MALRVLVLPSPLLGPVAYRPLVEAMQVLGHPASVAGLGAQVRPDLLVDDWTRAAASADVLVAHSNAGYLAPAVAYGAGGRPVLFMDAALPPAAGTTVLAPPGLRAILAGLADDGGRLPPWTRWWPADEMAELLPEPWRERVDSTAPRLDLTYFDSEVSPPVAWSDAPCAYLAFGATYGEELAFARSSGWPTAELPGHHLWHLARPGEVAEALLGLRIGLDT